MDIDKVFTYLWIAYTDVIYIEVIGETNHVHMTGKFGVNNLKYQLSFKIYQGTCFIQHINGIEKSI